jgi:VCBS repeat-containing protein
VRDAGTAGGVSDVFTYTLKDGDGDMSHTTLTLAIGNSTPTDTIPAAGGATTTVSESGLAARGAESAGSNSAANTETTSGTISFTSPDGLSVASLGGHALTGAPQTFTDATGSLTASYTYNAGTGTGSISYSYTLLDNTSGDNTTASFAVVVTDADGGSAPTGNLVINIVDDVPTAHADTDSVAANKFTAETGNVITAVGTTNAGADTLGADSAVVAGVAAGNTNVNLNNAGTVNTVIQGTYGKLTLQADGSYSYVRDAGTAGGNSDVFTYTLRDSDGDMSHTTLTISIGDSNPTDSIPAAGGATTTVFESGLPARGAESAGSNSAANTETTSGTISFTSPDGLSVVSLGGHALSGVPQSFPTATGSLTASYTYNAGTGTGSITYSYTLLDNTLVDPSNVSFAVVVTDADGDSAAAGNLVINIIDDVPTAVADTDSVAANKFTAETGNVITAVGTTNAGADTLGADGAVVAGVAAGNTNVNLNNAGTVNTVIQGTYGKLTLQTNGSYSYARDAGTAGGNSDVFTYTLRDGDGDMSHTTLTISIGDSTPSDTIPAAGGATTTVFEKGLPVHGGLPAGSGEMGDGNGTNNSDTSETTSGTIAITSPDGLSAVSLGGHALTGAPQTFTDATGSLTASYTFNSSTGTGTINYSYTLLTNTSGDNTSVSFGVALTDLDGDNAPAGNLVINIVDDVPSANLVIKSLVPAGHDTNLMLVLDVSGSMADPSGLTGLTRLDVLKASVTELLNQYADLGNVRVQIVSFSSDASQAGSNWMTVAQAKAAVAGLAAGGSTDYDAAVASAETLYPAAGKLATAGVQNISYFMSDGVPNESNGTGSNGIVGGEITAWQNFLTTNSIVSFSLGIGTGSTQSALDPLAYNGVTHTDTNAIIVTDPSQLTQTLVGTVSRTGGNILTDGNLPGSFGADGGHVQSITVDGTVYTYNPAAGGSISVSNGADHGSFDTTTNTETVTLASGGVLTMIMDNGTYTYTAPANVPSGFTDTIPFVLVDNDGDVAGNNLQIVVSTQDHAPIVRDDHVITNVPSASGADQISVPDYALLYNDSDPEGQTITITGVSGATDGTAVHSSSVVTFTEESNGATDGGTFNYTGSANGLTNTATVTVDRAQANENTLDGAGLGDVLIGRDGNGSTINGNEGNDVLIGGNQGDVLNGGTGDDLMVGGAGKDTMTGGTGKDIFVFTATSDSATTSGNADVITDFVHGQDIIDLSAIDSNSGVAGDQAFTFNGTTPTARGVWFTETGGNTVISIDTNGNSASAEMMIVLTGINKGLTAADFHL